MSAIFNAFATHLSSFAAGFSPAMRVAYPGVEFKPPTQGMWLELAWFPNETQNYGLANSAPSLEQGFGQVAVCFRPGSGLVPGLDVAAQVVAHFAKGSVFGSVRVYRKPWASSVLEDPDRVMIPVTVMWRGLGATVTGAPVDPVVVLTAGGILRTAGAVLGGHRIVRSTGALTVDYASSDDILHGDDTLGMTTGAADMGANVTVQRIGPLSFDGWAWTAGEPVFLGLNGLPTQTPPESGFIQVIGHAENATTLYLQLQAPIYYET